MRARVLFLAIFFFNDTATTEIYTLSLHDALPIFANHSLLIVAAVVFLAPFVISAVSAMNPNGAKKRSEEHTSELQSRSDLVCRLLLEKKKIGAPPITRNSKDPPDRDAVHSHAQPT